MEHSIKAQQYRKTDLIDTTKIEREEVVSDGSEYYKRLIFDISKAEESIDLEVYIFEEDTVGAEITETLFAAAKKGVKIRVMLDGIGSLSFSKKKLIQYENAGIPVRIYHPLPWYFWHWRFTAKSTHLSFFSNIFHLISVINRRNHRKYCIIDQQIVWVGSFNISKCHLSTDKGGGGWRDTAVRLQGFQFDELQRAFDRTWDKQRFSRNGRLRKIDPLIRLNEPRRKRRLSYKELLMRIEQCKFRIRITNAYFIPEVSLLNKLSLAASRGVDVKILLPGRSDLFFMPWASNIFYNKLLENGVRIFEYQHAVLHAKTFIIDDWITVGSSNLNHRSLTHDLEVDAILQTSESKKTVSEQFLNDLRLSKEILLSDITKHFSWKRMLGRLALYLRYWL
ncbi:phosphatidylserine/phosphatidylglycerophosphate/cardiolipin synthase family protein [bacterium]|nr:phosphatidylserine/phosphatidylglycerophosphate/cardiolipin synthase family protein [bacterium]